MKQIIAPLKPYLRWFILGGSLFFLLKTFKDRFAEVTTIKVSSQGWWLLVAALIITLVAHIWSGYVWTWILAVFRQSFNRWWGIKIYLITNIAKYLPGNIWHFYGRISAVSKAGGSLGEATLSVLLEPLLMAAAALLIGLVSSLMGWVHTSFSIQVWSLQILALTTVLIGIHPRILQPILQRLSRSKAQLTEGNQVHLHTYPLLPLIGEIGFVLLRGVGFILTVFALYSFTPQQIPSLMSAFSFAWLLGLIVPGAPGGIGVFEATAIAILADSPISQGVILAAVACFRLISILAEAIAAGLAWLLPQLNN
ncbi:hypothetical protein Sta7437_3880 [Stanieria cyanosphaera PCC 7437]|uniref:Uncharacterized protein n=1 Tax=Stanieria cyanosphaera (strain ATCC 29371 / PCC 7437) TaxID=111780 RepID=K9XZ99_STAC7|nr:YbhN family protein [Stanieria cyanosphaera]AFZ37364.1 hypothetical protein Sta7437_3880 [Stanieria cyanosphaera PCC 7437]